MKVNFKSKSGITLVALIITIIVLLILAMVSIALVMNSGIITKSKTAVDKYSEEEIQEQIKLAYSEWQMGQYSGVTEDAPTFIQNKLNSIYGAGTVANVTAENGILTVELTNGKTYTYNVATGKAEYIKPLPNAIPGTPTTENSKYTSDGKTAVIPEGYTISNVEAEQSIDTGLVIKKDGNEWVWIPVANVTDLYTENTTNQEWILCGTSGDSKVVSQYASKARTDVRYDLTRTTPGTTSYPCYREPDTVVGDNGNSYDKVQENWSAAGFVSFNDMATKLKDDYKNMIDSVRKNGGFYVGRYELSEAGTKKDQPSLTNTNWYNLYAKCKTFGDESTTYSRMIWGCQWDQVCKFISTSGDKVSLTGSRKYGNYRNSQAPANTGNYSSYNKQNTGSNEAWKTNNIYDLAGNCVEFTQEAGDYSYYRATRGGDCNSDGDIFPVTKRDAQSPTGFGSASGDKLSCRPVLYVK